MKQFTIIRSYPGGETVLGRYPARDYREALALYHVDTYAGCYDDSYSGLANIGAVETREYLAWKMRDRVYANAARYGVRRNPARLPQ